MEFEAAAQRLAKDQSKLRGRRGPPIVSAKAKREAEYRKRQQEKVRAEREKQRQQLQHAQHYMTSCDRALGVTSLAGAEGSLRLKPSSIYGDGDKIALPPSVLQRLTEHEGNDGMGGSSPWTFRIGLLRSDYAFPESRAMKEMQPPADDFVTMADSDDEEEQTGPRAPYLEELSHKYIAYTHGTVVEFTQDEGHVGLPASIASALLDPSRRRSEYRDTVVPVTRTVDPAATADDKAAGDVESDMDEEKTPGHLAWGAFDVPNTEVEISLLTLPKGKGCTLVPTEEAIQNGFYDLKDVKLVLEQSLIRTRATLSVGDTVHTWHRGFKFDLSVFSVTPSNYNAVSCINTDIEVEIGSPEKSADEGVPSPMETGAATEESSFAPGAGRVLSSSSPEPTTAELKSEPQSQVALQIPPEPPLDQKEGVCTVQIRGPNGSTGRHRFDVTASAVQDLFAFAGTVISESNLTAFRLVTRFPRKVYSLDDTSKALTLSDAGVAAGQELFMVERLQM